MHERISDWDDNFFGVPLVDDIFQAASRQAADAVRNSEQLRHLIEPISVAEAQTFTAHRTETSYIEAAQVLESVHLTRRQQEIARLIVGTAVVSEHVLTHKMMTHMFSTGAETLLVATSTLTARKDYHTPRGLRFGYRVPLLTEVVVDNGDNYYEPAKALQWCCEELGRSPVIDRAAFDAAMFLETRTIDNL